MLETWQQPKKKKRRNDATLAYRHNRKIQAKQADPRAIENASFRGRLGNYRRGACLWRSKRSRKFGELMALTTRAQIKSEILDHLEQLKESPYPEDLLNELAESNTPIYYSGIVSEWQEMPS